MNKAQKFKQPLNICIKFKWLNARTCDMLARQVLHTMNVSLTQLMTRRNINILPVNVGYMNMHIYAAISRAQWNNTKLNAEGLHNDRTYKA